MLIVGLLFGVILVFVTPPFQSPDEPAHFCRAYQIADGRIFAGGPGDNLPSSISRLIEHFKGIDFHPERKVNARDLWRARAIRLSPDERQYLFFPNSALYTPIPYIPQAVGCLIGRLFTAPPLVILYLARLTNLLASTLIIAIAIRITPAYRSALAFAALLPMSLFIRSTTSGDALTAAIAFLLVGIVLRLTQPHDVIGRPLVISFAFASLTIALCKPVYFLLPALILAIPRERFESRVAQLRVIVATAAMTLTGLLVSAWSAGSRYVAMRSDVVLDPSKQLHAVLHAPLHFLHIVATDLATHSARYVGQIIGNFGWLDAPLHPGVVVVIALAFAGITVLDGAVPLGTRGRVVLALVLAGTVLIIDLSQYLIWTAVGADVLQGVQGRYFIPIVPLAMLLVHGKRFESPTIARWLLRGGPPLMGAITVVTVWLRYWSG